MGSLQMTVSKKWAKPWVCQEFEEWKTEYPEEFVALIEINRMYREYRKANPDAETLVSSLQGEEAIAIVRALREISHFQTNFVQSPDYAEEVEEIESDGSYGGAFYASYPGLEKKDYIVPASLEAIEFDDEFDLEQPDHRLLPKIKFAEGNFSFPVTLGTKERARKEEKSFQGLWVDANLVVGGCWYTYDSMTAFGFVYTDTV